MTKTIRCAIALIIVISYCAMVTTGKISVDSFAPIMMYVVKKFMDNMKGE